MKQGARRKNKNKKIVMAFFVLLIAVAAIIVTALFEWWPFSNATEQTQASPVDQGSIIDQVGDQDDKQDVTKVQTTPIIEEGKNTLTDRPANDTDSLNVWTTVSTVIDGKLVIRVQIDQSIGSGTCELTVGDYSTSAPVSAQPQSATCAGFDVPISAYTGSNFTITVRSGNKTGTTTGAIR